MTSPLIGTALLVIVAGLTGVLSYQLAAPVEPYAVPPDVRKGIATERPPIQPFLPPAITDFSEIDSRPPFNSFRKPLPRPEAVAETKPPSPPPNLALVGVILDGKTPIAIAKLQGAASSVSLRPGQTIEGWRVAAVRAGSIELENDGERFEVKLQSRPPGPGAIVQSQAVPPAQRPPFGPGPNTGR